MARSNPEIVSQRAAVLLHQLERVCISATWEGNIYQMSKVKRGGYVFLAWKGSADRRVRGLIEQLDKEGLL